MAGEPPGSAPAVLTKPVSDEPRVPGAGDLARMALAASDKDAESPRGRGRSPQRQEAARPVALGSAVAEVWRGLRALQAQQLEQVAFFERLQVEVEGRFEQVCTSIGELETRLRSELVAVQGELSERLEGELAALRPQLAALAERSVGEAMVGKVEDLAASLENVRQQCDLLVAQRILSLSPKAPASPTAEAFAAEDSPTHSLAKIQEFNNRLEQLEGTCRGQQEELQRLLRQQLRCEATTGSLEVKMSAADDILRTLRRPDSGNQLRTEMEALRRGFVQEGQERDDQIAAMRADFFEHRRVVSERMASAERELRRLGEAVERRPAPPPPTSAAPTAQLQALWDEISRLTGRAERLEADAKMHLDSTSSGQASCSGR
ncbi:unnamed protein product [Symbiodinium natans]|uniref:Uncharacterized protein n=1 Tax=Symbiodinium natans TaxID=878477 RepID=A0A812QBF4_9DINO|nr:unnamed protein product [Symbiodinium natans]